jgi:hypothetical protein
LPVVTDATVIAPALAPECVPVSVAPPLLEVHFAVWLVIALPLSAPRVNVTINEPVAVVVDPDTARTAVGAAGTVEGITVLEAADAGPVPTSLVAVTVNV